MVENTTYEKYGSLKEIGQQIRSLMSKASFLSTKQQLSKSDVVILKMQNLLMTTTGYFGAETRLYISNQYITLAQVVRIMAERGESLSRSGCENRILLDVKKFVKDFGPDAAYLLNNTEKIVDTTWLSIIELKIIAVQTGFDYTDNSLDNMLKKHGIGIVSPDGYTALNKSVTPEDIEEFLYLIEPYTEKGIKERREKLNNLGHIAWAFRKGIADGSNNDTVTTILQHI